MARGAPPRSEHVGPIAGTASCQAAHLAYFVSGRMVVQMDDGERMEYGPSDVASMPPGHDAWIVGDERCVIVDWQGSADYAKRGRLDRLTTGLPAGRARSLPAAPPAS